VALSKLLADLVVQFTVSGLEDVKAGTQAVHSYLQDVTATANSLGQSIRQTLAAASSVPMPTRQTGTAGASATPSFHTSLGHAAASAQEFGQQVGTALQAVGMAAAGTQAWAGQNAEVVATLNALSGAVTGLHDQLVPMVSLVTLPDPPSFIEHLAKGLQQATDSMAAFGGVAGGSFAGLKGSALEFIQAGLQSGSVAETLSTNIERLSGTVAAYFRPQIDTVLQGLPQMADWFKRLSSAQQANIVHWTKSAAAGQGLTTVLPKVAAGIQPAISAVHALALGLDSLAGETSIGQISPVLEATTSGLTALTAGTQGSREALSGMWEVTQSLNKQWKEFRTAVNGVIKETRLDHLVEQLGKLAGLGLAGTATMLTKISGVITDMGQDTHAFMNGHPWLKAVANATALRPAYELLNVGKGNDFSRKEPNQGSLLPKLPGFAVPERAWSCIAEKSRDVSVGQKQLDVLVLIQRSVDGIWKLAQNQRGLVRP
jgi:hypothetical protein